MGCHSTSAKYTAGNLESAQLPIPTHNNRFPLGKPAGFSMASKDFDIDQLAAYLHLTPDQVTKMASRGKLPGRKVNGAWKFSESEIHHWLEEQIGIVEPDELQKVERILEKNYDTSIDDRSMLWEFMSTEAISIPLDARTRSSVAREMANLAARTGLLWDASQMAEAVLAREALHPTALENGVALLHPRRPQSSILSDSLVALGISPRPIPFGNTSGLMTDVFFLICSTDDQIHLKILARLARLVSDEVLLTMLRSAQSPAEVIELIRTAESELVASDAR
jgi:PTS system nitrogen regulatory IIA component